MESVKKNQIHILELRNTSYKIKNSLDMLTTDLTKQKGLVNSKTSQWKNIPIEAQVEKNEKNRTESKRHAEHSKMVTCI